MIEFDKLLLGASLDNVFNKIEQSNQKINTLFSNYEQQLTDSSRYSLLYIQQTNYSKLYEYKKAYESVNIILDKYSRLLGDDEIEDLKNTNLIWKALAGQPKQTIVVKEHTVLKVKLDKANLSNLEITQGKKKIDFIFDTGANISTVTQSTAKKLKMKMMQGEIDVTSITGIKIKSGIAVCPEIKLGGIIIKNAVFLVFPDEALAVPQIKFQINGIIGFPIIEALNEVQITQSGEFIVPKTQTVYENLNMALDFLTPVIELNGESYSFDSGADETMLYNTYYNKHKNSIDGKYEETDYRFGGAGGSITKKGYYIPFNTIIDGKDVILEKVIVFKDKIKDEESDLYGNIGQDLIKKFQKLTLNFELMFIKFD
ncbi:MAG: retropepsin-like aspartic protease [Flavobacteriales bacterium]